MNINEAEAGKRVRIRAHLFRAYPNLRRYENQLGIIKFVHGEEVCVLWHRLMRQDKHHASHLELIQPH